MFRLLKLKPPHGWNAVAWELGIVTLGVLIALAAQQVVEALNDRSTAAGTRAEVVNELNSNLMSLRLRDEAEPCVQRRLAELRKILADWQRTRTFRTPQWVAQTPVIEVELSRYDAAVSAGRMALLSGDDQYRIGTVVDRIRRFNDWQFQERRPWGRLRLLQAGSAVLSPDDRAMLREALQDASAMDYEIQVNSRQALDMARGYGFRASPEGFREMAPKVWPGGRYLPSICTSIDTPRDEANETQVTPLPL
jgi:hypothetical protein